MAATAALEAHRLDPARLESLALAARALEGAKRAQTALAQRPGGATDDKLATYLHLKANSRSSFMFQRCLNGFLEQLHSCLQTRNREMGQTQGTGCQVS